MIFPTDKSENFYKAGSLTKKKNYAILNLLPLMLSYYYITVLIFITEKRKQVTHSN